MRYEPDHKARIHRRIVKNASRQLRAKGLNGPAVTALMKASGLSHGGFYRHFGSRDDLVVEAIEESLLLSAAIQRA
jgi:TetR/AcrR family transcriptional regulator, transcriptional repressor for nem operon